VSGERKLEPIEVDDIVCSPPDWSQVGGASIWARQFLEFIEDSYCRDHEFHDQQCSGGYEQHYCDPPCVRAQKKLEFFETTDWC